MTSLQREYFVWRWYQDRLQEIFRWFCAYAQNWGRHWYNLEVVADQSIPSMSELYRQGWLLSTKWTRFRWNCVWKGLDVWCEQVGPGKDWDDTNAWAIGVIACSSQTKLELSWKQLVSYTCWKRFELSKPLKNGSEQQNSTAAQVLIVHGIRFRNAHSNFLLKGGLI